MLAVAGSSSGSLSPLLSTMSRVVVVDDEDVDNRPYFILLKQGNLFALPRRGREHPTALNVPKVQANKALAVSSQIT